MEVGAPVGNYQVGASGGKLSNKSVLEVGAPVGISKLIPPEELDLEGSRSRSSRGKVNQQVGAPVALDLDCDGSRRARRNKYRLAV